MVVERALRGIAGTFILLSVALALWHSTWWLLFTAFVGANLLQSAFSDWCPMKTFLQWAGVQSCEEAALRRLEKTRAETPS